MKKNPLRKAMMIFMLSVWAGGCVEVSPSAQQQAIIGEPQQSECLQSTDFDGTGSVEIKAAGDTIMIVDHYAEFNCCLAVWMEVTLDGNDIVVVEVEDPDDSQACDCICPYELSIGSSNLAEGNYHVKVYQGGVDPRALIHEETVCLGCTPQECQAPVDCLDQQWGIYCMGHWDCVEGSCKEVCDFETCGDDVCDAAGGENEGSCRVDCQEEPTCQAPIDCLDHVWLINCFGHWECIDGACAETCDADSCGDGQCDPAGGENEGSCPHDCVTKPDPVLKSFSACCQSCGAEECYQPDPPYGQSRLEIRVEPTAADTEHYLIHALHDVLCLDVNILGAELLVEGSNLILVETFDYDNPFDCYCTQRADILIAGLSSGTYQLQIYNNDRIRLLIEETVVIP